jgi:hypothetical protein
MTDKLTIQSWPMSTRTPETKLTVDGEFTRIGNPEPPSITFHQNGAGPVMIIRPDGKIELGAGADPTEAAAQCIEAMGGMMQTMIGNAVKAEREAIVGVIQCRLDTHSGFAECAHAAGVEPSESIYAAMVELRALLREIQQ